MMSRDFYLVQFVRQDNIKNISVFEAIIVRNDWVVWVGSVLLFLSGCVWARSPISFEFFVVRNIIELATVFGGVATAVAVVIALRGINAWKLQIAGASDHELSREVVVCLRKYQLELSSLWGYADSAATKISGMGWVYSDGVDTDISIFQFQLDKARSSRAELESVAIACAAIWGGIYENGFNKLYLFEDACSRCINAYIHLALKGGYSPELEDIASQAEKEWERFESAGVGDVAAAKGFIDSKSSLVLDDIKKKLLRVDSRA